MLVRRVLKFNCTVNIARRTSTQVAYGNDSSFPYPPHRNPTPHQIFHLPHNASEADIKARYFDLVRIYHPDKAPHSVPSEVAHARFQSITRAYDALRGKVQTDAFSTSGSGSVFGAQDRNYQTTAALRAAQKRRQELYNTGAVDDRWKDRIIFGGVVLTMAIVVFQISNMRRELWPDIIARSRHPEIYGSTTMSNSNASTRRRAQEEARLAAQPEHSNKNN